jgi:hypothetical protein
MLQEATGACGRRVRMDPHRGRVRDKRAVQRCTEVAIVELEAA